MANESQTTARTTTRLLQALGDDVLSASELIARLQCSQPTLSRWINAADAQIIKAGRAQRTRYARSRDAGVRQPIVITRIDESGSPQQAGELYAVGRDSGVRTAWVHGPRHDFHSGLPWFMADMRPQGFLGRLFPARVPQLNLPSGIADWSDNHVLRALCSAGADEPGNLILGHEALNQFLSQPPPTLTALHDKLQIYSELAVSALAAGVFPSSAGGEQPKFTAYAETPSGTHSGAAHVIVKFSPVGNDAIAQRWRDLLRAEHHALTTLDYHGVSAARSRVMDGERLYLEIERFDRVGARGRRGVVSLNALDDAYVGERHDWISTAMQLCKQGMLSEEDARRIALLQSFGRLIHNTDMHFGNCALFHNGPGDTRVQLAPIYDMLPMRFAPTRQGLPDGAVPQVTPAAAQLHVWAEASALARTCWERVLDDGEISVPFRDIAHSVIHLARSPV